MQKNKRIGFAHIVTRGTEMKRNMVTQLVPHY